MRAYFKFFLLAGICCFIACEAQVADKKRDEANIKSVRSEKAESKTKDPVKKTIVFFGNSLSAAYGLSPSQGFVSLIEQKIDSLELPYKVLNLGLSGETTAAGKSRIDWVLKQQVDVFVLELGGNDALRGTAPSEAYKNLQYILDQVKSKYPSAKLLIAGMEAPPNMGPKYAKAFRDIYPKLAKVNGAALIPFLLKDVGGIKDLNLPDGIHPTAEGHKIVMATIWEFLEDLL